MGSGEGYRGRTPEVPPTPGSHPMPPAHATCLGLSLMPPLLFWLFHGNKVSPNLFSFPLFFFPAVLHSLLHRLRSLQCNPLSGRLVFECRGHRWADYVHQRVYISYWNRSRNEAGQEGASEQAASPRWPWVGLTSSSEKCCDPAHRGTSSSSIVGTIKG